MEIKAYHRREERYEGLQLVFYGPENKQKILDAIENVKKRFDAEPKIYENCYKDDPQKCAYYLEFEDDYDKIAGEFFEELLKMLGISKCE